MRKLLKITTSTGILTLAKMALGFIIAKVVAVYTGPSGMALLGQIQGFSTALAGIINSPVTNGIVKFTAENNKKGLHMCLPWWRASLIWVLIIYIFLLPILLLMSTKIATELFGNSEYYWVIILISISLPLSAIGSLFISITNGLQNYNRFIFLNFFSVLFSSLLMIFLIINYQIKGAIIAAALQSAFIGLVIIFLNLNQSWVSLRSFCGRVRKIEFNGIGKYVLMAITSAVTLPVSLIIIRNLLISSVGWEEAGLWQAVWKVSEVYLSIITIALSTYYLPKLAQLDDMNTIIKEVTSTAKFIIPFITLVAVLVYFLRDFLIGILFTDSFRESRNLFGIQLIGDVVKVIAWLYAFPMLSRGAVKWYVGTELFFGITFVFMSFLLIPYHGAHGVNYAYLFSYILYSAVVMINVSRY